MIVLKILAAPFVVVLTVLAAVVSFLFCMATAVFVVACVSDLSLWHPGHRGVAGG